MEQPVFGFYPASFVVTLPKIIEVPFSQNKGNKPRTDFNNLENKKEITRKEVESVLNCSKFTAINLINELFKENLIEKSRPAPSVTYKLKIGSYPRAASLSQGNEHFYNSAVSVRASRFSVQISTIGGRSVHTLVCEERISIPIRFFQRTGVPAPTASYNLHLTSSHSESPSFSCNLIPSASSIWSRSFKRLLFNKASPNLPSRRRNNQEVFWVAETKKSHRTHGSALPSSMIKSAACSLPSSSAITQSSSPKTAFFRSPGAAELIANKRSR